MSKMTFVFLIAATVMGITTFSTKQKVASLSTHLYALNHKITLMQESKRIYSAEWNYLNEPSRLQRLANKHLHMNLGRGGTQLAMMQDIINLKQINTSPVQLASMHQGNTYEKPKL